MIDFDAYIRMGEPGGKERAEAWKTAIGLQAVDGLKTSEYLNDAATKHIEGDITIDQVRELIDTYYQSKKARTAEDNEKEEADKATANITKIINEPSFSFSLQGFTSIHRRIFSGIFKFAGNLRDYEFTKREWVLDGDTIRADKTIVVDTPTSTPTSLILDNENISNRSPIKNNKSASRRCAFVYGIYML